MVRALHIGILSNSEGSAGNCILYLRKKFLPFFNHKRVLLYSDATRAVKIIKRIAEKIAVKAGGNMYRLLLNDERGAVTIDWVTLTAGILLLGIMIVYSVMNDSAGYLMDEFEDLNAQYAADAIDVSALGQQIDTNQ